MWNARGEKVFLIDMVIALCTQIAPKISPVSVILLNVCYFGFFAVIGRISVNGSDGVILVLIFAESVRKYLCISLCNCTQKPFTSELGIFRHDYRCLTCLSG